MQMHKQHHHLEIFQYKHLGDLFNDNKVNFNSKYTLIIYTMYIKTHDSESQSQGEAGHMRQTSELWYPI